MITAPPTSQDVSASTPFGTVADEATVARTAAALQANGFVVHRAPDADAAREIVLGLIPDGSQVHQGASHTLDVTGITTEIEQSGRFDPVRPRMFSLDRQTQAEEIRHLAAAPAVMLGSVHAITESGSLVAASMSGSQLGPYASGAGQVILVAGTQKIVADLDEAMRRIEQHTLPLEDARAQAAYGVNSAINKLLIINRDVKPGRITVVLIDEAIGY